MTPETFQDAMRARLGAGYRLRWSHRRRQWQFEHQMRRAIELPVSSDATERLRDGYHLIMESPEVPCVECPRCDGDIALPVCERAEVFCPTCQRHGAKVRVIGGYFPLTDMTLTYLEQWHPRRGPALAAEMKAANAAVDAAKWRHAGNVAESLAADDWRRVFGIPRVGYTKVGTPHSFGAHT